MSRIARVFNAIALIMASATIGASAIHAAPPTVVPSPGYDARLQEFSLWSRDAGDAESCLFPARDALTPSSS